MSLSPRTTRRTFFTALGIGAGAAMLGACGQSSGGASGGLSVVTSAYPLAYLVTRIGGEHVSLTDLSTPGADAHGLELSIQQTMLVEKADLVLQIPGLQTALDDAIATQDGENVLDISTVITLLPIGDEGESAQDEHDDHAHGSDEGGESDGGGESHEGHDHGTHDPHFWHNPLMMADVAAALAARLGELAPESAEEFTAASTTLREELEGLDTELTQSFEAVSGERPFITSHAAYAYLAARYGLHQIGITGVDPENEPSPQRLLALERIVEEEGVSTIFFESSASPKVAQTLAKNLGIESAELDNLETQQSPDADYPQVMRDNCTALAASWT